MYFFVAQKQQGVADAMIEAKKLMRLHGRSISAAPQAVHDIEWDLYVLRLD